jgi:hypothetical protein
MEAIRMHVHDVHSRALPVAAAEAGALIDRLGAADDPRWPRDRRPADALELALARRRGLVPA